MTSLILTHIEIQRAYHFMITQGEGRYELEAYPTGIADGIFIRAIHTGVTQDLTDYDSW